MRRAMLTTSILFAPLNSPLALIRNLCEVVTPVLGDHVGTRRSVSRAPVLRDQACADKWPKSGRYRLDGLSKLRCELSRVDNGPFRGLGQRIQDVVVEARAFDAADVSQDDLLSFRSCSGANAGRKREDSPARRNLRPISTQLCRRSSIT